MCISNRQENTRRMPPGIVNIVTKMNKYIAVHNKQAREDKTQDMQTILITQEHSVTRNTHYPIQSRK